MRTYYVSYDYVYSSAYDNGERYQVYQFGFGEFQCRKKEIEQEVTKRILEEEIPFGKQDSSRIEALRISDCFAVN